MPTTDTTIATSLRSRETVAEGTVAFHFDKPEGFHFKPGQAIDLVLGELRHAYSIVSAPFEDELVIATRMRDSEFKRALKAAAPGTRMGIDGPFGSLTLHKDASRPAILIAGGIGITPFMSMLRQAAADGFKRKIVLVYSVRRPADAAFLHELREMESRDRGNFRLVLTVTQPETAGAEWRGETGHVGEKLIARIRGELPSNPVYYLAGPPAMVAGLKETLERAKVDEDDVRAEEFFGY